VLYTTPPGFEQRREWMLEADIIGCVSGLEKLSGYAAARGGRSQSLPDLTGTTPRRSIVTLVPVSEPSPVHGPAKRPKARPVAEAVACTCVHDGTPACSVADLLLSRFPSLARMAASTTAPFNVCLLIGLRDAMWHTLAHSTLKYGLLEV
jgi:hypothetical protein